MHNDFNKGAHNFRSDWTGDWMENPYCEMTLKVGQPKCEEAYHATVFQNEAWVHCIWVHR